MLDEFSEYYADFLTGTYMPRSKSRCANYSKSSALPCKPSDKVLSMLEA
jgi:hypothetical protein